VLNLASGVDTTVGSLSGAIATPTGGTNTATINNGGTGTNFTVNQTAAGTFAGVIAGQGNFVLGTSSTSTLTLTGAHTYTGTTTVAAGTLAFVGGSLASPITVSAGASLSFDTSATTTSTSTANISLGTIKITGTPSAASHTLFTAAGGITGTPVLHAPVPGYVLKVVGNSLVLEQAGYGAWAALNGAGPNLNDDHDNDGVPNGVEYFLGGPNGNTTGFTLSPGVTNTAGTLSVTWVMGSGYAGVYGTNFTVETSDTLTGIWTTETAGVTVVVSGSNVTYTFPAPLGAKKFARLKVTGP
jgi:autotransporter-associated beta strand protein